MKIVIAGTTGIGKSTTVELLEKTLIKRGKKVQIVGELVVDSPFLDLFFKDIYEWGFLSQLDFLMNRFKQYIEVDKNPHQDRIVIFDRHFLEDLVFSELRIIRENRSKMISNTFKFIFDHLLEKNNSIEKPDYIFLLRSSFDTVVERLNKRGRKIEITIDKKYWQDLYYRYYGKTSYKKMLIEQSKKFIELDTDLLNSKQVVEKILRYISKRDDLK